MYIARRSQIDAISVNITKYDNSNITNIVIIRKVYKIIVEKISILVEFDYINIKHIRLKLFH